MNRQAPGPGQESVWDYPRPPRLEPSKRTIQVIFAGEEIANTTQAFRVLETSHPPVYYIPPGDVRTDLLSSSDRQSFCEFKGLASYRTIRTGGRVGIDVAWTYTTPAPQFQAIAGYLAFYPGRVDACYVDGEQVQPQPGDFYGGWITADLLGPFKGASGTLGW